MGKVVISQSLKNQMQADVSNYLSGDSVTMNSKIVKPSNNYLKKDYLAGENNNEIGNRYDIAYALANKPGEKLNAIKGNTTQNIVDLFTHDTSVSMWPNKGELNNIEVGVSIVHFKRLQEDYKLQIESIDVEEKPGWIIIKGKPINHPLIAGFTMTVHRNPETHTGYFL